MNPIVGIGEVLWDVYPDGRKVAGGAPFNFVFHCHQLGHPAVMVSRVGDDDPGRELRERIRALGLSDEYIQTDHDHPTGTVRVVLDASAVPTFTIIENVAWDALAWAAPLEALAKSCPAVCFGSLGQRSERARGSIQKWIETARGCGRLAVCDVNIRKPHADPSVLEWCLDHCDWIKVNETERATFGYQFADQPWPDGRSRPLWIVTRGADGCEVTPPAGPSFREPGVAAEVVDTVGAGDAFTAAMVCLHLEGKSLRDCARFAVHYAARVCEQPGGTPKVVRAEVERAAGLST